jgi:hypothetical protein
MKFRGRNPDGYVLLSGGAKVLEAKAAADRSVADSETMARFWVGEAAPVSPG